VLTAHPFYIPFFHVSFVGKKRDDHPVVHLSVADSIPPGGAINFEHRQTLAIAMIWLLSIYSGYVTRIRRQ
ncbi:hypothetical protein, partial [Klebsiella quasipneumoniae]|uniref:hypothetical protein n=1 Tax=Klebsiella quasipneumoniae TaxID=1463165 RepID=UPI001CFA0F62